MALKKAWRKRLLCYILFKRFFGPRRKEALLTHPMMPAVGAEAGFHTLLVNIQDCVKKP